MTDGVTEKAKKSQLLDSGLSTKMYILANPYILTLKCYGEDISDDIEISRRHASKKSF